MKRITITQMAEKAGVSVATISRAINPETREKLAEKTLIKIDKLIKKYNYTPNFAAKTLRKSTTKIIGIVLPYFGGMFHNSYYVNLLAGVSDVLFSTDYNFKLLLLKKEGSMWDNFDFISAERIDGLIITDWPEFFSKRYSLERSDLPCVILDNYDENIKTLVVSADQEMGGSLVAEKFYQCGHRHFAILTGLTWSKDSQLRVKGFCHYLKKQGIIIPKESIVSAEFQEHIAYNQIGEILKNNNKITAIFCCNDHMAFGVIRKIKELGLKCPGDISVIGYDNQYQAASFTPPLTTVSIPIYELAQEGTRRLIKFLKTKKSDKKLAGRVLLPIHLIQRNSVSSVDIKD